MRQSLNYKTIKDMMVVFPPLEEQQKIAAYLDEKCAKIDTIIEKDKWVNVMIDEVIRKLRKR